MPFAKKLNTLIFEESSQTWVPGAEVVVTKNSLSAVVEPASAVGKTAIRLNDGSSIRVNATLDQILDFLNDP